MIKQTTPDAGVSTFWYDRLGRLAVSQNAQQKLSNRYSYTLYDAIGRIVQVGQKVQGTAATDGITRNASSLWSWLNATYTFNGATVVAEQVTSTLYDVQDPTMLLSMKIPTQRVSHTLRNRVSTTRYLSTLSAQSPSALADFDAATTYSYDIHGNVDTLVQQYRKGMMAAHGDNRFKVITYQYDLISGKVNQVHYQPGEPDQYYHRYAYDAENRITDVYTTTNKALIGSDVLEDHEAFYSYYKHGPLARTILGQQQVQGVDYAYTLQGWLKGVNSMALDTAIDMGKDGGGTITARDAYGFQLNYFTGDYKPVNTLRNPFPGHSAYIGAAYRPLYNGNISSMGVNIGQLNQPQLYNYEYDQLNRLVSMQAYRNFDQPGNSWSGISATTDHQEAVTYDGNGNITAYLRNGNTSAGKPLAMDNLGYHYNKDGNGNLLNNRLRHVTDGVTATANYTEDIDGQVTDNYHYDQIGNLTHDTQEQIDSIEWNVYGKISRIWKNDNAATGALQQIAYRYDPSGNRISKTVYSNQDASNYKAVHTWYVRDASGNVMATYTSEDVAAKSTLATGTLGKLYLSELHMYGSSRLGIWNRKVDMDVVPTFGGTAPLLGTTGIDTFNRGNKFFELANHLGNVLVTVSDRKVGQNPVNGLYSSYTPEVVSASDYAPFGMQMVGRTFSAAGATAYRYGFNGQEKSQEVTSGNYTAEYWEYDSRIGRRWNIDPIPKTSVSGYMVLGNNPVSYVDPNGADWYKNTTNGNVEYKAKWHRNNHDGYQHLGKDNGGTFTHEGTTYNRKDMTVTVSLDPVVVTASRKKPSMASRTSWGQVFNQITPSLAQETRNDIANYIHSRDAGMQANNSLYTNGINLERHYIGDKQGRNLTLGFTGAVVLPLATFAAVESGGVYYAGQFLARPFLAATGRYGATVKVLAWMQFGNASADLTYQTIKWGITGDGINLGSTFGNLYFKNPLLSSLPGAIINPEGSFLKTWGRGALGDAIGNIPIPGVKIGTRLGMEGFTMPLLGNLISDVITGQYSKQ